MLILYRKFDVMDIINAVSNRILELCKEKHITVNRLANLSAVAPSTLKNIVYCLSKNPKIVTIKMLCDGLEITMAEFFSSPLFGSYQQKKKEQTSVSTSADDCQFNTLKTIKYRILQLCEINRIPIYKLEAFTGVPTVTINNILYGKSMNPKLNTIKQICDGLDITLAEFFDTDEFNNLEQEIK